MGGGEMATVERDRERVIKGELVREEIKKRAE
jgi:hypothetical protein